MEARVDTQRALEEREKEREKEEEEKRREEEIRQGKIYGTNYHRYRVTDIGNVSDIDFLSEMYSAIIPAAQPHTEWEYEELSHFLKVIRARIDELQK